MLNFYYQTCEHTQRMIKPSTFNETDSATLRFTTILKGLNGQHTSNAQVPFETSIQQRVLTTRTRLVTGNKTVSIQSLSGMEYESGRLVPCVIDLADGEHYRTRTRGRTYLARWPVILDDVTGQGSLAGLSSSSSSSSRDESRVPARDSLCINGTSLSGRAIGCGRTRASRENRRRTLSLPVDRPRSMARRFNGTHVQPLNIKCWEGGLLRRRVATRHTGTHGDTEARMGASFGNLKHRSCFIDTTIRQFERGSIYAGGRSRGWLRGNPPLADSFA